MRMGNVGEGQYRGCWWMGNEGYGEGAFWRRAGLRWWSVGMWMETVGYWEGSCGASAG